MKQRHYLILISLLLLATLLRFPYLGALPESWDAVDFALALQQYDLYAMQPHFPGYPFFILWGMLLNQWIDNPYLALSTVSFLAGIISIVLFFYLARLFLSPFFTIMVTIWFTVHPLLWLTSVRPMSDSMGLMMALLYLNTISRSVSLPDGHLRHAHHLILAAILYAMMLGVRLSYFPLGIVWFYSFICWHRSNENWDMSMNRLRYPFLAIVLGLCTMGFWVWAVSLGEGGIGEFLRLGQAFTSGHFTRWGGTLWSPVDSIWDRLQTWLIVDVWQAILGGTQANESKFFHVSAIVMFIWVLCALARWKWSRKSVFLLLWISPLTLWVFLGQNVDKPRHIVPLIPAVILIIAIVIQKAKAVHWLFIGSLVCVIGFHAALGFATVNEYLTRKPPVVNLAEDLKSRYPLEKTLLITWEEQRVTQILVPRLQTERLQSWSTLVNTILRYQEKEKILLTSAVVNGLGKEKNKIMPYLTTVVSWQGNPRIYSTYHRITVYQLNQERFLQCILKYKGESA